LKKEQKQLVEQHIIVPKTLLRFLLHDTTKANLWKPMLMIWLGGNPMTKYDINLLLKQA
jgi:hypothetical protein